MMIGARPLEQGWLGGSMIIDRQTRCIRNDQLKKGARSNVVLACLPRDSGSGVEKVPGSLGLRDVIAFATIPPPGSILPGGARVVGHPIICVPVMQTGMLHPAYYPITPLPGTFVFPELEVASTGPDAGGDDAGVAALAAAAGLDGPSAPTGRTPPKPAAVASARYRAEAMGEGEDEEEGGAPDDASPAPPVAPAQRAKKLAIRRPPMQTGRYAQMSARHILLARNKQIRRQRQAEAAAAGRGSAVPQRMSGMNQLRARLGLAAQDDSYRVPVETMDAQPGPGQAGRSPRAMSRGASEDMMGLEGDGGDRPSFSDGDPSPSDAPETAAQAAGGGGVGPYANRGYAAAGPGAYSSQARGASGGAPEARPAANTAAHAAQHAGQAGQAQAYNGAGAAAGKQPPPDAAYAVASMRLEGAGYSYDPATGQYYLAPAAQDRGAAQAGPAAAAAAAAGGVGPAAAAPAPAVPVRSKFAGPARKTTFEDIKAHFHMPMNEAAKHLEISLSTLKKRCRKLNIKRWPFRKIRGAGWVPGMQIDEWMYAEDGEEGAKDEEQDEDDADAPMGFEPRGAFQATGPAAASAAAAPAPPAPKQAAAVPVPTAPPQLGLSVLEAGPGQVARRPEEEGPEGPEDSFEADLDREWSD